MQIFYIFKRLLINPSFIAGFSAFSTAQFFGIDYTYFDVSFHQSVSLDIVLIMQVILAGLFFGFISDITITTLRGSSSMIKKIPFNSYVKAFAGGIILIGLSLIVGDQYFGLGLGTIDNILQPDTSLPEDIPWYGFFLKTIFTSITLGVGGSGSIVTPLFYIGATSGHVFGTFMGDHISFFAALGFVSVLAGTTNTRSRQLLWLWNYLVWKLHTMLLFRWLSAF